MPWIIEEANLLISEYISNLSLIASKLPKAEKKWEHEMRIRCGVNSRRLVSQGY